MKRSRSAFAPVSLIAIAAFAMAACNSSDGSNGSKASGEVAKKGVAIDFVSGPSSDPFFGAIQKGAEDAASAQGADLDYITVTKPDEIDPGHFSKLIDTARAKNPDIMLVSDFFPSAMGPKIRKTKQSGIPVILVNSGASQYKTLGLPSFFGQDEKLAGTEAAHQMIKAGVKNGLCIDHVPGNPAVGARCVGFKQAFKEAGLTAKTITTPLQDQSDPSAMTQDIKGALQSNKEATGVFTLGSNIAAAALKAVQGIDRKVNVGTTDISKALLQQVKTGKILFVIDQQPYLQGYLAATTAILHVKYGLQAIGEVKTGPLVITRRNVDQVIKINNSNPGVRGAQ